MPRYINCEPMNGRMKKSKGCISAREDKISSGVMMIANYVHVMNSEHVSVKSVLYGTKAPRREVR